MLVHALMPMLKGRMQDNVSQALSIEVKNLISNSARLNIRYCQNPGAVK